MAVLVIYAQPSLRPGDPGAYHEGDVVSVWEDGQHPGTKNVASPMFAFVKVPGSKADWLYLLEEYHFLAFDSDGFLDSVAMIARRKRKLTVLENPATKTKALGWGDKTPTMTKVAVDRATVDKSKVA